VNAHESSAPFLEYRERLRSPVGGESAVPNISPFAVKGYEA